MGQLHNFSATLPCLANQVQVSSNTWPERFSRFGILLLQRISSLSSLWLISWKRKWTKEPKTKWSKKSITSIYNLHIESTRISFFQIFWEKNNYINCPSLPLVRPKSQYWSHRWGRLKGTSLRASGTKTATRLIHSSKELLRWRNTSDNHRTRLLFKRESFIVLRLSLCCPYSPFTFHVWQCMMM